MLEVLIYILVVCIVIGTIWWVFDYLPVPEPLNKIGKVASIVIGIIVVVYALLSLGGGVGNIGLPQ